MRWLFLFVFTLNLAYIGWELSKPSSDGYADVAPLKNVEPVILLSELKQRQIDIDKVEADTEGGPADEAGAEEIPGRGDAEIAVAEKQPQVVSEVVQDVGAETSEQPAPVEPSKPAIASLDKVEPAETMPVESSPAASCYTLGPFRDLDRLRGLTREIKTYVDEADFRGHEEKEPTLYWVYITPESSRKKAIETGNRLKAKKIKDFYVIREGKKENGLSLGHFRNKDGAYGLAKKVKNLGFDVMVEPVFKTYTIYWLDYQLSSGVTIPESIFDKHIKASKKEKISRLSRDCGA